MKVSIVIPVYNRLKYTKKCLESIFEFGSKYEFEIIVVDNASSDGTREYLQELGRKVVAIVNEKNLGFAKACNQGASKATGEYLLFLNNDTVVTDRWMDVLIEELDADPEVAIAGSKLLYPDETIQHAGVVFAEDKTPYHIYSREIKEKHYVNKKRKFNAVTAACMLVRKELFDKVGGFDEDFLNGYEDIDFCLKIRDIGKDIMYCPESVVYHYESITEGRGDKHKENQVLFLEKWGERIEQDDFIFMEEDSTQSQSLRIKNQENEIRRLRKELELVKSSVFWKMRDSYLKFKFVFNSPKRFIKKYFKKIIYLFQSSIASIRNEGLMKLLIRSFNYVRYGRGVLNPLKIEKEDEYVNLKEVLGKFSIDRRKKK